MKKSELSDSVGAQAAVLLVTDPRFRLWLRGPGGVRAPADAEDLISATIERVLKRPPANDNGVDPEAVAWRHLAFARKDWFRALYRRRRIAEAVRELEVRRDG